VAGVGNGFALHIPTTTLKIGTLKLFVGTSRVRARLTVSLSGGDALFERAIGEQSDDEENHEVEVKYRATNDWPLVVRMISAATSLPLRNLCNLLLILQ